MNSGPFLLPRRLSLLTAAGHFWLAAVMLPGSSQAQETPPAPAETHPEETATGYPTTRYDKIRVKSPFEFELAKPPAAAAEDPFQDLVLAGYAGSASSPTVYLANTKTQERLTIVSGGPPRKNDPGFRVISVNRGRTLKSSTATLEKNGVTKELSFDPKALASMVGGSAAAPGARPGMPGTPGAVGPNGQPIVRPGGAVVPPPNNRPAMQPYQAPQAFIPGAQAGGNQANGTPQVNLGLPNQPNNNVPQLMNNNGQIAPGQVAAPAAIVPHQGGGQAPAANTQPRRRVVLPTQP